MNPIAGAREALRRGRALDGDTAPLADPAASPSAGFHQRADGTLWVPEPALEKARKEGGTPWP